MSRNVEVALVRIPSIGSNGHDDVHWTSSPNDMMSSGQSNGVHWTVKWCPLDSPMVSIISIGSNGQNLQLLRRFHQMLLQRTLARQSTSSLKLDKKMLASMLLTASKKLKVRDLIYCILLSTNSILSRDGKVIGFKGSDFRICGIYHACPKRFLILQL